MLKKLRLAGFKNFNDAELTLGPLTLLVGENASGKSNIREAFRFLHGISRGYTLAEIMGEKWVEGGVLQWRGIRGGPREIAFRGAESFALEATFIVKDQQQTEREATYRIEVNPNRVPYVTDEDLAIENEDAALFKYRGTRESYTGNIEDIPDVVRHGDIINIRVPKRPYSDEQPILSQVAKIKGFSEITTYFSQAALNTFGDMRFLDLSPEAMRRPSLPGQTILGDRGENLSSVLQHICATAEGKETLIEWIQELTPMDARDFKFVSDLTGRIILVLVEKNGQETSAYSASDGTLRFLAMIAALLGPKPARFYFFEELDTGLHPSRLHLLLQLLEQKVADSNIQIVATTHASQLLNVVSPNTLANASLIYRQETRPDAQIKRILDIPDAARLLQKYEPARLHAMGWFEDTVSFTAPDEEA